MTFAWAMARLTCSRLREWCGCFDGLPSEDLSNHVTSSCCAPPSLSRPARPVLHRQLRFPPARLTRQLGRLAAAAAAAPPRNELAAGHQRAPAPPGGSADDRGRHPHAAGGARPDATVEGPGAVERHPVCVAPSAPALPPPPPARPARAPSRLTRPPPPPPQVTTHRSRTATHAG